MEKLGLDIESETPSHTKTPSSAQEARRQSIELCIKSLEHATDCSDKNCKSLSCVKMKKVVSHAKSCKRKSNMGCPICKQLIALCCYHAKSCKKPQCSVPYCSHIKAKMKQQQLQQKVHQQQVLRRRIAAMSMSQNPQIQQGNMQLPAPRMPQRQTPPNVIQQKPIIAPQNNAPPNLLVQPQIHQQSMDMSNGMHPNMAMMGSLMSNQSRFLGPSVVQPGMSVPPIMGQPNQGMINSMSGNDWALMQLQQQQQQRNHLAVQAQMSGIGMMGMPGQTGMMASVNQMNQSNMTQNPQLMQQLMNAMRGGNGSVSMKPQLIEYIRSQNLKIKRNSFMPNVNNQQVPMQPNQNTMNQVQWQFQKQRMQLQQQQQQQQRRMQMNMNNINSGAGFPQQSNPRLLNRQFSQEMLPPTAGMINNQPSPQMMGGRVTPGITNHQMMSPQSNIMSPPLTMMPNPSPRPCMSPSHTMRVPSPHPAMSPQHIPFSPSQSQHQHQSLTSPMHTIISPSQSNSIDSLQQPSSVLSERGGGMTPHMQNTSDISMNGGENDVEDYPDPLLNFIKQL